MCDCNAPFVITGFTYELINKYDKVKTKVVDGACCSECLENIVIPQVNYPPLVEVGACKSPN